MSREESFRSFDSNDGRADVAVSLSGVYTARFDAQPDADEGWLLPASGRLRGTGLCVVEECVFAILETAEADGI